MAELVEATGSFTFSRSVSAPSCSERAAANKRARGAGLRLRKREPIGLVACSLAHRVVYGLRRARAHDDSLFRRVATAELRGARYRVGGGLRRRNVDIRLRAACAP